MAAGNRSPLGFGVIALFHLCLLAGGVFLQNVYERYSGGAFLLALICAASALLAVAFLAPRFYWDIFRGFKSAAILLTLLVLSCILGTLIIQDLDLRRDGVFESGVVAPGEKPVFSDKNQFTRFALAESHAWLWIFPNEERREALEKVKLSETDKLQVALRKEAFGERAARAYEQAILGSQRRHEAQRTTSNFASDNQEFFYSLFLLVRQLHLFDIFESWWFYILLGLIGLNVIVGTMVRAPWNVRDAGIAITHSGILIILAGALLDLIVAKEGYIHFTYGRPELQVSSAIYDQKTRTETELPFRVYLERFATEYYHELMVERVDWSRRHDGRPWQTGNGPPPGGRPFSAYAPYPVRAGVTRSFEDGGIKVIVHEYKPRVFVDPLVEENPEGPLLPAVKLGLYNNPRGGSNFFVHGNSEPWFFAFDERRYALDRYDMRFEYVWADDEAHYRALLRDAPVPDNGDLILKLGNEVRRERVDLGKARRVRLGDRELDIEFVQIQSVLAEEENVNLAAKEQRTEQPALYLRVNGQVVRVYRDEASFTAGYHLLPGLEYRFEWPNPRDSGVVAIARVVSGPGLDPVLVQARPDGGPPAVAPLEPGRPVPLGGPLEGIGYLGLEAAVTRAREARRVREVPDAEFLREGGGARDSLLAAWADVEIQGPWGTLRREMTPFDRPISYGPPGQPPLYAFALRNTGSQRDWFSVLSVLDRDGNTVKTHSVQVNSPLRHRGWRFFQATAGTDRDGLGVSGISVTYNPGVNFMYVGYTVLTLGVCWIFFVRPVLDWRRRRLKESERMEAAA